MDVNLFKGRHFEKSLILVCFRWYIRYALSYRDLVEMMLERGISVSHTTIYRWVVCYGRAFEKRVKPYLRQTRGSLKVDETYVKIKGQWTYLYRAVDTLGQTIDFYLSPTRDAEAAKKFFRKALSSTHHQRLKKTINVDKNAAFPKAISELKEEGMISKRTRLRQVRYLNNNIEQDHRRIKRLIKPGMGFKSFSSAEVTIAGYEMMAMIRKGQLRYMGKNILKQNDFITTIMSKAA